jgi:hypothetical protein
MVAFAAVACPLALSGLSGRDHALSVASPIARIGDTAAQKAIVVASRDAPDWLLDPTPSTKPGTLAFAREAPLATAFRLPARPPEVTDVPPTASPQREHAQPLPLPPARVAIETVQPVPLPAPRPADLQAPKGAALPQMAVGPVSRRSQTAALPAGPVDNRSFFEKLLGMPPQASGPALGYAAVESGGGSLQPGTPLGPAANPAAAAGTAVYDISARLVYMPNGEKLEAHSGLGDKLDDPRFVHVRMHGATPPGIYDLTEREQLFHGVRAIRLNPLGGSAAVHGRSGLLAHTYMLGPNGDSNGCVSFRRYDKFLQAFLKGEVKRLVVVAGRGQDRLPSIADGRTGARERSNSRANDT